MTCPSGKPGHPNEKSARMAARAAARHGAQGAHAYRCDRCRDWHAGSNRVTVAKSVTFLRPRAEVPDDPAGTTYCVDGCGHPTRLHGAGVCLGRHGACPCRKSYARDASTM